MRTRSSLAAVATLATLALAGAVPAYASAHPAATTSVLTSGSAGGTAVAVGASLSAPLASGSQATFYSSSTGTTGVVCTSSQFTATVTANPTAPGSATESLTGQTFGGCSSNVVGVSGVQSITVNGLPYTTSVSDASGDPITVGGPIQTTVVLNTLLGSTTCVYTAASLSGNASNTANTITFSKQHFTKSSGSSLCFSDAYFSAVYGPVTTGGSKVFVN